MKSYEMASTLYCSCGERLIPLLPPKHTMIGLLRDKRCGPVRRLPFRPLVLVLRPGRSVPKWRKAVMTKKPTRNSTTVPLVGPLPPFRNVVSGPSNKILPTPLAGVYRRPPKNEADPPQSVLPRSAALATPGTPCSSSQTPLNPKNPLNPSRRVPTPNPTRSWARRSCISVVCNVTRRRNAVIGLSRAVVVYRAGWRMIVGTPINMIPDRCCAPV